MGRCKTCAPMSATEQIEIRRLASTDIREQLDALASGGQDAARPGRRDRRRRRASLRATPLDEGRRNPRLRPLPRWAALRHDRLLEVAIGRFVPRRVEFGV